MADLFHFYIPNLAQGAPELPAAEARHAVSALRMQAGDAFTATDGRGLCADCMLERVGKGQATFRVLDSHMESNKKPELHLYVGPTKNHDRLEWLAEKLQELGVTGLHICYTEHSVRKTVNRDRLLNVAISALKQSRASYLMEITDRKMDEALTAAYASGAVNYVCYLGPLAESKSITAYTTQDLAGVINPILNLFIGPEGDFSQKELEWMFLNNFNPIRLTHSRLRTETAALAAASTWMCLA